jgi:hypothetical protein
MFFLFHISSVNFILSFCVSFVSTLPLIFSKVLNKVKNYAKRLDFKSKTDKIDAQILACFGLERERKPCQRRLSNSPCEQLHSLTGYHCAADLTGFDRTCQRQGFDKPNRR